MSMIEIVADLTVERVEEQRIRYDDGQDEIVGRATTTRTEEVRVDLEMLGKDQRGGHVNLEGFVVGRFDRSAEEVFGGRFVELEGEDRIVECEMQMWGEPKDWIMAANRWCDERPNESIETALRRFRQWECVDEDVIDRAVAELRESREATGRGH